MDRKTFAKEIEDQFGPQLGKLTVESIRHLAERLDDTVTVNRVEYHNLQNKVLKLERQVYESSKTESEARGFRRGMDRYNDFQQKTKGVPVNILIRALNNYQRGVDYGGCNKGLIAESFVQKYGAGDRETWEKCLYAFLVLVEAER
tara:strand:- start:1331 stop:1768 length:438 start_codon:yes stop_codon:yes gene_type:complete